MFSWRLNPMPPSTEHPLSEKEATPVVKNEDQGMMRIN